MNDSTEFDYDVIVIGAGGAGMCAAISAADGGAKVALLEAGERVGGSTALSGGFVFAANTAQQREQGVQDSVDDMVADIIALNGDSSPPEVVRAVSSEAPRALQWLQDIGVNFPTDRLVSPNGRMTARSHEAEGYGARIAERLDYEVSRREIDLAVDTRVEQLVVEAENRVAGVLVNDIPIRARAVVIACGGIGGDPQLLERMEPKTHTAGDWLWHVGCAQNRGDGLRMAENAGASICGNDSGLFLSTPYFNKDLEVIGPDWVLLVNSAGERIVREDAAYWELSQALEAQSDGRGYCIFSDAVMRAAEPDPRVLEALADGTISLSWVPQVLEEQLEKGRIYTAASITKLAEQIGVDDAALQQTVARYNAMAENNLDSDFNKQTDSLNAIDQPPYYAVEVRPAVAIVTGAGPTIDAHARVISSEGQPIAGLYAAGECTGNVYGRNYVGSGYAIASAISMGRISGREAAAFSSA